MKINLIKKKITCYQVKHVSFFMLYFLLFLLFPLSSYLLSYLLLFFYILHAWSQHNRHLLSVFTSNTSTGQLHLFSSLTYNLFIPQKLYLLWMFDLPEQLKTHIQIHFPSTPSPASKAKNKASLSLSSDVKKHIWISRQACKESCDIYALTIDHSEPLQVLVGLQLLCGTQRHTKSHRLDFPLNNVDVTGIQEEDKPVSDKKHRKSAHRHL